MRGVVRGELRGQEEGGTSWAVVACLVERLLLVGCVVTCKFSRDLLDLLELNFSNAILQKSGILSLKAKVKSRSEMLYK